ncbi:DNA-directed RNA polymerase subunit delta [Desulfosporosinus sp.]|uniref:DNA-directed RNA polymerase subunit delta n=1 Tax=Desulfosporosinus sp. TaxID=157907 RepID=UPI000E8412A5|nr:DNA-directed RNA polymerase subunit delta [Desulfosporosinus sp.]MBC2721582.1 DNA-directed RNA polymerase subunit delta [Desulfosporosinus sp.]MBC2727949.1 DNA-directed RNA polymerase subunit delta [Desulfosporosinus sp.]HBV86696.1 DNA-directed RNA polymerase subunit delta [Desulfosporosinus sp.]
MTHSLSKKNKPTEADIAFEILKAQGNPMHYQNLIEEVLRRLGISQEAIRIAAALTQINLDTRFTFLGKGEWGLKVWDPAKTPRRSPAVALINKESPDEDDKSEPEELEDDSLDEDVSETDEIFDEADEGRRGEKW